MSVPSRHPIASQLPSLVFRHGRLLVIILKFPLQITLPQLTTSLPLPPSRSTRNIDARKSSCSPAPPKPILFASAVPTVTTTTGSPCTLAPKLWSNFPPNPAPLNVPPTAHSRPFHWKGWKSSHPHPHHKRVRRSFLHRSQKSPVAQANANLSMSRWSSTAGAKSSARSMRPPPPSCSTPTAL